MQAITRPEYFKILKRRRTRCIVRQWHGVQICSRIVLYKSEPAVVVLSTVSLANIVHILYICVIFYTMYHLMYFYS